MLVRVNNKCKQKWDERVGGTYIFTSTALVIFIFIFFLHLFLNYVKKGCSFILIFIIIAIIAVFLGLSCMSFSIQQNNFYSSRNTSSSKVSFQFLENKNRKLETEWSGFKRLKYVFYFDNRHFCFRNEINKN